MDRLQPQSLGQEQSEAEQSEAEHAITVFPAKPENGQVPLVTDLDGTLVATDTLVESVLSLCRRKLSTLLFLPVWLFRGKAALKSEIAKRIQLDPAGLPYRQDVVEYLRAERAKGRRIVLATASHETTAAAVATHLGLFDQVLASTDAKNLKGTAKRDELVKLFGARGFDYIGDSNSDIPVWAASGIGHVAGSVRRLPGAALAAGTRAGQVFSGPAPSFKTFVKAIRIHQWVKNVLVFVPAILNHYIDWSILRALVISFFCFSLVASGSYLANDLFDLDSDRKHPRKSRRPLASGQLPIAQGIGLAILLLTTGIALSFSVNLALTALLLVYLGLTAAYSSFLKGRPILDVVTLAMLYTLRVYTGGVVAAAYVSPWLFQFSIFLFLSLAFVKRYSELVAVRHERRSHTPGRGYRLQDLSIISQAGVGSGLLAGLVLALYINDHEIESLYPHWQMLWFVCPLFIYWIVRVWLVAHRGNMHDDPIVFAFRDRVSYLVGLMIVIAVLLSLTPKFNFLPNV